MPDSDASLMGMAALGQSAAFLDVMRRHGPAIHAYLARRTQRDVADDLLSEVLLRAYAARRQYDKSWNDARPWLYGIARNVLREHWRRAGGTSDLGPEASGRLELPDGGSARMPETAAQRVEPHGGRRARNLVDRGRPRARPWIRAGSCPARWRAPAASRPPSPCRLPSDRRCLRSSALRRTADRAPGTG